MTAINYCNNTGKIVESHEIAIDLSGFDETDLQIRLMQMKEHLKDTLTQARKALFKIKIDPGYDAIYKLATAQAKAIKLHIKDIEARL